MLSGIQFVGVIVFVVIMEALYARARNESPGRGPRRRNLIFLFLVVVGGCGGLYYYNNFMNSSTIEIGGEAKPYHKIAYGIMFDAGSTGSRIHVFKFSRSMDGSSYNLLDELFLQVKPGLSAYAKNPVEAAESLRPMLDQAKDYVPESSWAETNIGLKATAGLRLISNESAMAILNEVEKLFRSYPFRVADNAVEMLEGVDEGLYSWFTVNLLEGALKDANKMVGVMDLGGGSTQLTYALPQPLVIKNSPNPNILKVRLLNHTYQLYTRSYLGLGLNSARFQIIGGKENRESVVAGQYSSPCFPDGFSGKWKHAGAEHSISHAVSSGKSRYELCYEDAQRVVKRYNMDKLTPPKAGLYTISYYYDKAVGAGLIHKDKGGIIEVQDFCDAAKKGCDNLKSEQNEFYCMDLTYICSLLRDGLGLPDQSPLTLRTKIKNVEIAWPLGAMFNVLGKFNKIS